MVNFNKFLLILTFLSLSLTITTTVEAKKLSISLMTDEELIYNQCVSRGGKPTHIAKKDNDFGWDTTSVCKTYTKIPSDKNLAKPKNPQKKISISLMTDEELIYNRCVYTRDGTPTHIAKKNKAYKWDDQSTCKTYIKLPSKSDDVLVVEENDAKKNNLKQKKVAAQEGKKLVNENEENLKKLHSLIMNNKDILKSKYIKISDKQEKITIPVNFKNNNYRRSLVLAVYLNYENVLKQIESNPNLTDLGRLTYGWEGAKAMYRALSYNKDKEKTSNWGGDGATIKNFGFQAIEDCERKALKRKLSGGKCVFVDFRKYTGSKEYPPEYINYLLVDFKDRKQDSLVVEKNDAKKDELKQKKAAAEKKKKLAEKKIEEEKKRIAKIEEEIENQELIKSKSSKRKINKKNSNSGNLLKALATNETVAINNKKKIIRYECQQPWDITTEDYRPLLDVYELDLKDRVLKGTHRYITDKEYVEERIYPVLATDKDRVLVRYDSPNGDFSTKFFFNYGTDQSIVATDNSYKTKAKCVNRDYFVDIKVAKNDGAKNDASKNDLKILELEKKEAILAQKEIEKIEKEQKQLLAKQNDILKNQKQKPKVAKLKVYEDPKKLNISLASSISKSQLKKYNATSAISYLFFESSENYLISLELLYRAYDLNTEADKIKSHLGYIKDSKSSEKKRLSSTKQIVKTQSLVIMNNIKDESLTLSEQGKIYYAQSLPYALNAAISTYNLYHATTNAIKNVGKQGDIVVGILNDLNNIMGIAQIIPELPEYSKNMYQTTKLIISSAKVKKIKDSANVNKALDDLNLET